MTNRNAIRADFFPTPDQLPEAHKLTPEPDQKEYLVNGNRAGSSGRDLSAEVIRQAG